MLGKRAQAAVMIAGAAALVLIVRHIGAAAIAALIRQVGWSFWLATLIYAAHTALRGVALWQTLPPGTIPLLTVVGIRFGTEGLEMLTLTGPLLAEPAKAWLLHRRGLDGAEATGAVAAEYLLYNLAAAWMAAAGISLLLARGPLPRLLRIPAEAMLVGVALLTLGCLVAGLTGKGMIAPLVGWVARVVAPRHALVAATRVAAAEAMMVAVLHDNPRRLVAVLGVELASHGLLAWEVALVLHALHLPAGLTTAFIIEGAVKCVNTTFFFVPGQIGVSEGVYAVLLPLLGFPAAAGVTLALVRRARALVVGGAGFLLFARPGSRGAT
jgi:lysylphosphatidylglycerol synthase-like protein